MIYASAICYAGGVGVRAEGIERLTKGKAAGGGESVKTLHVPIMINQHGCSLR